MNTIIKRILLVLLVIALAFTLIACSGDETNDPQTPPEDGGGSSGAVPNTPNLNQVVVFEDIKNALVNTGADIAAQQTGVRNVTSDYTLIVNGINIGITYRANYDYNRKQDSEIYLEIYDYITPRPAIFVYYANNDLYYRFDDKLTVSKDFGGSSTFELFFDTITVFDLEYLFFEESFAQRVQNMGLVDNEGISRIKLDEDTDIINIRKIELNIIAEEVRNFIANNFRVLGDRFDAITETYLGFNLSDLGMISPLGLNAEKLEATYTNDANNRKTMDNFTVVFAGTQTDYVSTYYLEANYATSTTKQEITLNATHSPDTNVYKETQVGQTHLSGSLVIPALDADFKVDIKTKLNVEDNSTNQFIIDIRNRSENQDSEYAIDEEILMTYYRDGMLYVDATGFLDNYVSGVVDTNALNLPKVKFDSVNLAEEFINLIDMSKGITGDGLSFSQILDAFKNKEEGLLGVLLSKVRSEGSIVYVQIDEELVSEIAGGEIESMFDLLGEKLGIESEELEQFKQLDIFKNLYLEIAYDTANDVIVIKGNNASGSIFTLTLNVQETDEDFVITYPEDTYFATFEDFAIPESMNVHIDANLRVQGQASVDFAKFMGVFIGDITGVNTPFNLLIQDKINMVADVWNKGDETGFSLILKYNNDILVVARTSPTDSSTILVDNRMNGYNVKYVMPVESTLALFDELVDGKSILKYDTIIEMYMALVKDAQIRMSDNYISFTLAQSAMKELIGVDALVADVNLSFTFSEPATDMVPSEYAEPVVNIQNEVIYDSMYEARWIDSAEVIFGSGFSKVFKLTFVGDSATLVTGKNAYHPEAKLLGKLVTYGLYFSDEVNGTKVVRQLANSVMKVDPSELAPFPEKIDVVYEDNTRGKLDYVIEGFPYNNGNISQAIGGVEAKEYVLIVGKDSIAEQRFKVTISIMGRMLLNKEGMYNNIPIVDKVEIDPYEYAINKLKDASYNPIRYKGSMYREGVAPTTLRLLFTDYKGTAVEEVHLDNVDWNFDLTSINYGGGVYTVTGKYNTLDIALEITVFAKRVAYVQINTENNGYYTVDSLKRSTYTIPSITDENNEVRIYFESGNYRIIGEEPAGYVKTDDKCDGYYPEMLDWEYKVADSVASTGVVWCLNNGTTDRTSSVFGTGKIGSLVGTQKVSVNVVCPDRIIPVSADTTMAVTSVQYASDGTISIMEKNAINVSAISFTESGALYSAFNFDPYSGKEENLNLPKVIYADVVYQGRTQRIAYPVTWVAGLEGQDNIIDENGRILNALVQEEYLRVTGYIGDAGVVVPVTALIHNLSGEYERVIMKDADGNVMTNVIETIKDGKAVYSIEGLNPYDKLVLPAKFELHFPSGSGIEDREYDAEWLTPEGTLAVEHIYPYGGGEFMVYTELLGGDDTGMLDQVVELKLVFKQMTIINDLLYGISTDLDAGEVVTHPNATYPHEEGESAISVKYVVVDGYSENSRNLIDILEKIPSFVGITFVGETAKSENIPIIWNEFYDVANDRHINELDNLIACLKDPRGSSTRLTNGEYDLYDIGYDLITMTGVIYQGTPLEQNVSISFMVKPKVLTSMTFTNYADEFKSADANGIVPVDIDINMKKVEESVNDATGEVTSYLTGNNTISIVMNKPFMLKGTLDGKYTSLTPSQYIDYLFSNVKLAFSDSNIGEYTFVYDLDGLLKNAAGYYEGVQGGDEDAKDGEFKGLRYFDKVAYGQIKVDNSEYVTYNNNVELNRSTVTIKFKVDRLSNGSVEQTFDCDLTVVRDNAREVYFYEYVETFDENGLPKYTDMSPYEIDEIFQMEYEKSGLVTYNGLVWRASYTYTTNGVTIVENDVVNSVSTKFFRFTEGISITLHTTLVDGTGIHRNFVFLKKNVGKTEYNAQGEEDIYNVVDGTLTVYNVYEIYPLMEMINKLPQVITPKITSEFLSDNSGTTLSFTIDSAWAPSDAFKDDNGGFSEEKLKALINSSGIGRTLFATATISGYNNAKQTIELYIEVFQLAEGDIYSEELHLAGKSAEFDPYSSGENDGTLELPQDILVKFGDESFKFKEDSGIKYMLRNTSGEFNEVKEIIYNKAGHAMGTSYGGKNDTLYFKLILPDGNETCYFTIKFLNRTVTSVTYENLASKQEDKKALVEGLYYVDPYNPETWELPSKATFVYGGSEQSELEVRWENKSSNATMFTEKDGVYSYTPSATTDYMGGVYLFVSHLRGFGEQDPSQYFIMTVVVLNREMIVAPANISSGSYKFDTISPFAGRVEDIPSDLTDATFFNLTENGTYDGYDVTVKSERNALKATVSEANVTWYYRSFRDGDNLYGEYNAISTPVVPRVFWGTMKNDEFILLNDDDINILGGFEKAVVGYVGTKNGEAYSYGQLIPTYKIMADSWEFVRIDGIDSIIEFNRFTMSSLQDSFDIVFKVDTREVKVPFYPEDRADDNNKRRTVIKWGDDLQEGDNSTHSITLANLFKTDSLTTEKIYKLVFQQLYVDEISFGYGDNNGYGTSGQVNVVIDPLNPVIPTSAYARGRTSNEANAVEVDLGVVSIAWEDTSSTSATSIYNLMFGGGERTVVAHVYDKLGNVYYFNVRVSYLNRMPSGIYTSANHYSNSVATNINGKQYYALMLSVDGKKNSYFNVDPIGDLVYNRKNPDGSYLYTPNTKYVSTNNELIDSVYVLPSELKVLFANNYTAGSLLSASLDKLGSDVLLTNVKWIISSDITLSGTKEDAKIVARVAGFNVQYETKEGTVVSQYYDLTEPSASISSNFNIQLSVEDRTVQYTSISYQEGPDGKKYQQANVEYFVDPYNVSFPNSILVKFTGIAREREFTNIEWEYNEGILKEVDIVSGKADDDRMYLMAGFPMFGTRLEINFRIKARYIDANIATGGSTTGMKALKGGTLYVLKGIPVEKQLPTRLYYAFGDEIASVPLEFTDDQMSIINVNNLGAEVVIRGNLGIDTGNIEFTVKVIDPEVFALRAQIKTEVAGGQVTEIVTYQKSGFRYNEISVGVNRNGVYAVGPEVGLLPERIIVTEAGDYLEVANVDFDTNKMIATFNCKYTFLSAQDDIRLSGSDDLSGEDRDKLAISFTVPIVTYDYSATEATFAELSSTTVDVELGAILDASLMPTVGEKAIKPFWYLSDVNTNRAGTYKAICYFKNAYGETISGEVTVNVKRRKLSADNENEIYDVSIAREFLNKNYTGEQQNIEDYLTFSKFLREDGTMGDLEGYTVEYSLDGGETWQLDQPINVPTNGIPYKVRIIIYDDDDYNYTGSIWTNMIINKTEISADKITFHKNENDNLAVTNVSYVYNGREQIPFIKGIPLGATYDLQFAMYEEGVDKYEFSNALRPTNVGKYIMRIAFTADQRNYLFTGTEDITAIIEITKKTVDFKIERNMVYSGAFMDAKVIGIPESLGDMRINYKYYLGETPLADGSRIKNVGTYNVIVTIDGGTNYNSAELRSEIYILPKDVVLNINEVSSEYLDDLKPFNSAITITDALDPTLSGLQGTDTLSLFGNVKVKWEGGTLTNKHMVGEYVLVLEDEASVGHANYNIVAINNGKYRITAMQEGARVINDKQELDDAIALLENEESKGSTGLTVKWYLRAGDYGDITINVNASVTIIGSYDLSDEKEEIAVKFNTITVNKGAVLIDIVSFKALGDKANVLIASRATSVTVKRSEFIRQGESIVAKSMAIRSEDGFKGSVYVYDSYVYGYAQAIYLYGGKLEMERTTLEQNVNGVYVRGDVIVKDSTFKETRGPAINIATQGATVAISGNTFKANNVAIESASVMRNDIEVQNVFIQNATNIKKNY